ncbi:SNF2_N-domain-containing protein, partial [Fragilariopsis cylindrus CCMP1102]
MTTGGRAKDGNNRTVTTTLPFQIGKSPKFVNAVLRSYQVEGVNWLLSRYNLGTGCIVADEMGLGKTIQSLSFIAALKNEGLPGPHLVVTPLAVLQNWANEIKRFTPGLSHIKIHGSMSERDRLLSRDDVLGGEFDVYLTTYDTFLSEEAFFTESFLFHTVIIDEGHRLKNASCKLCKGLARLNTPFRVLLTGTPLQNCLAELIALLQYILPSVPIEEHLLLPPSTTNSTDNAETKGLDRALISQARILLESCMIRRIKSEVEASLLPKIEYVLKPPLTRLQRKWYRSFLESDGSKAMGLLSKNQLMMKVLQLGKVANHPKAIALTYDQLRGLVGEKLVNSCGKLALLDRLMLAKKQKDSRVLVFSQFTLTLDVLEEYVKHRFGRMGVAYLRLDGTTGRIQREMDMRSYNKPGCGIFCYLISTRAGGQGINLATADTVILYDTCWNPQVDLQAQDRAHRIGQKKQVFIYRLISENTVEERVLARARQKMMLDALV